MWRLVGAVALVFAAWSAVFGLGLLLGLPPRAAELGSAAGAGATLVVMGLLAARAKARRAVAVPTLEAERRRAV